MNTELSATPRYKIVGNDWLGVNGLAHPPGTEFPTIGWPPNGGAGLKGLNEPARRILSWLVDNRFDAFKPVTPWNAELGRFYLPGKSADTRADNIPIIPPDAALPNMPAYKALKKIGNVGLESVLDSDGRFPHRVLNVGDVIVTLDWPRFNAGEFDPANPEAEDVLAYFADAREHPKLLPSPWNWFNREVFLPDLPGAKHWGREYPAVTLAEMAEAG